jgi:hypothetical protein
MTQSTGLLASPQNFVQSHVFNDYFRKWVFLGVLIGIVAGLGAIVFTWPSTRQPGSSSA